MPQLVNNDALGGAGSLAKDLRGVAVYGLSRLIDSKLAKKYPVAQGGNQVAVDSTGSMQPASAPSRSVGAGEVAMGVLQNPFVIAFGLFIALGLVVALVVRSVK